MPRIIGASGKERTPQIPNLAMEKFAEGRINQGMVTMIDPADIPPGALQLIKNATVRFDRTSRRPGSILLVPEKPDSQPVLRMAFIKKKDGSPYTVRMTPQHIYTMGAGAWSEIVFAAGLHGSERDRFNTADVLDTFCFTNNGADEVQTIDFAAATGGPLGNAPKYRYFTGFYNRGVGFARKDTNEVEVGWSGDGNIVQWDPLVDETAGNEPLLESPDDLSDFIKGGFSFTNLMIILREKSIWHGQKQPIPQNPFYISSAVPGVGCDCPFSAKVVGVGQLAWVDRRTGCVYAYSPGSLPEAISRNIEKTLFSNVDDPDTIFAAYNPIPNEYTVYIPGVGSNFVQAWTYNFRGKAWAYNEYYGLTSADDTELAIAGTTVDQLGDVAIDDLVGTVDDLSPTSEIITSRAYGRNDGTIMLEDINEDLDAPHTDYPLGVPFDTLITSKAFTVPEDDIYIAKIVIEYQANRSGTFKIEYSKDGGATDDSWRVGKTVKPTRLGKPTLLIYRKVIKARRFAWRLTTTAGLFETLAYEVHVYPSGQSGQGE